MTRLSTFSMLALILVAASSCVDRANTPQLVPVGTPVLSAAAAHSLCVGEGNLAFDRAGEEFERRERMTLYRTPDSSAFWKERQSRQAAHQKYMSCIAASGFRPIYGATPLPR